MANQPLPDPGTIAILPAHAWQPDPQGVTPLGVDR